MALADVKVVVMPDRSIVGRAVYDTVPGTGNQMSFILPPDGSLLWATADFNSATPLRSSNRTWSIPCDDRRPSRVGLIWKTGPSSTSPAGQQWQVPLPRAGTGSATTLVSVYAPPRMVMNADDYGGLEPVGMARLEMARADWFARNVGDLVAKFDRSSGRDHEKLVSLLINHEMALRSAQRNVQWTEQAGTKNENHRATRISIRFGRAHGPR